MTFEQAIELLRKEYERAQKLSFVKNPLAYAFFSTWKTVDALTRKEEKDGSIFQSIKRGF